MQLKQKSAKPTNRRVAKSRPINVNFPLPKEAVAKLRALAIGRDQRLLNLGVLAVQIRDDENIVLGIELEKTKRKSKTTSQAKLSGDSAAQSQVPKSKPTVTTHAANWSAAMESSSVEFQTSLHTPKSGTKKAQPSEASTRQRGRAKPGPKRGRGRPPAKTGREFERPFMNAPVGASTWEAVYRNIGTLSDQRSLKRTSSCDANLETPSTPKVLYGDRTVPQNSENKRAKTASSPPISSPIYSDPDDDISSVSSSPCSHSPMSSDEVLNLFNDQKFSATSVLRQLAENHTDDQCSQAQTTVAGIVTSPGNAEHTSVESGITAQHNSSSTGLGTMSCGSAETAKMDETKTDAHHIAANTLSNFSQLHCNDTVNNTLNPENLLTKFSSIQSPTATLSIPNTMTSEKSWEDLGFYSGGSYSTPVLQTASISPGKRKSPANVGQGFAGTTSSLGFSMPLVSSVVPPKKSRSFAQLGIYPGSYRSEMSNLNNNSAVANHQSASSPFVSTPSMPGYYANPGNYYPPKQVSISPTNSMFHGNVLVSAVQSTTSPRMSQSRLGYYAVANSNNGTTIMSTCMNGAVNSPSLSSLPKPASSPGSMHPGTTSCLGNSSGQSGYPGNTAGPQIVTSNVMDLNGNTSPLHTEMPRGTFAKEPQPEMGTSAYPETAALPDKSAQLGPSADLTDISLKESKVLLSTKPVMEAATHPLSHFNTQSSTMPSGAAHEVSTNEPEPHQTGTHSAAPSGTTTVINQPSVYTGVDMNNNIKGRTGPQYALSYVYPMGTVWYPYVAVTPYAMLAKKSQGSDVKVHTNADSTSSQGSTTGATNSTVSGVNSTQYIDLASSLRYWQQMSLVYKSRMQMGAGAMTNIANPASQLAGLVPGMSIPRFADQLATGQSTVVPAKIQESATRSSTVEASSETSSQSMSHAGNKNLNDKNSIDHISEEILNVNSEPSTSASTVLNTTSESVTVTATQDTDIAVSPNEPPYTVPASVETEACKPCEASSVQETESLGVETSKVKAPTPAASLDSDKTECLSPAESMGIEETDQSEKAEVHSDGNPEKKGDSDGETPEAEHTDSNSSGSSRSDETQEISSPRTSPPVPELSFVHESSIACMNVGNDNSTQTTDIWRKSGNGKDRKSRSGKRRKSKK